MRCRLSLLFLVSPLSSLSCVMPPYTPSISAAQAVPGTNQRPVDTYFPTRLHTHLSNLIYLSVRANRVCEWSECVGADREGQPPTYTHTHTHTDTLRTVRALFIMLYVASCGRRVRCLSVRPSVRLCLLFCEASWSVGCPRNLLPVCLSAWFCVTAHIYPGI